MNVSWTAAAASVTLSKQAVAIAVQGRRIPVVGRGQPGLLTGQDRLHHLCVLHAPTVSQRHLNVEREFGTNLRLAAWALCGPRGSRGTGRTAGLVPVGTAAWGRAALQVRAAGQPSSPEALTVIVSPPGFTISVLDVDSRFTIVTWTVVLAPADSERTPRLMVRSSGSGFWTWIRRRARLARSA